jgi:hypothetical protein
MFVPFWFSRVGSDFAEIIGAEISIYLGNKPPVVMNIRELFPECRTLDELRSMAEKQRDDLGKLIINTYQREW